MSEARPEGHIEIQFLNVRGGGFSDSMYVPENTNLGAFFVEQTNNADPGSYVIRVNREAKRRGYILQEGDRVTFTPSKVEGALC